MVRPTITKQQLRRVGVWLGFPSLVYLAGFTMYAWTWMSHFNTRIFSDQGDGFQNVWNMWWINKAVTELHQSPWQTSYLHYPEGTTLVGQTLNPFNGFVGIILQQFFSLAQAYNIMVIFSFVFGGVTMFWLCYYFSRKYVPSLIGGFFFTFSSYHFAHAYGHLQLVSLEFIPLFILLWWQLLVRPRYRTAVAAAVVLLLVLLCDYYYFAYSVIAAGMIFVYLWRSKRLPEFKLWPKVRPWLAFLVAAAILCAPLPLWLISTAARDPLLGGHDSRVFSVDLFSLVINGGFWHFSSLTDWYWNGIKAYIPEASVYLGLSTITLLIIAIRKRNKLNPDVNFWLILGAIFAIFSLGPRLMVGGNSIDHAPLPYALLEWLFPAVKLSGVPNRTILMSFVAAAVLMAIVLARLNLTQRRGKILVGMFVVVLAFELWPGPLPINVATNYPKYVTALAKLPPGAVIDDGAKSSTWQLYDQTITERPMGLGYISRIPTSVRDADSQLTAALIRQQYPRLCEDFHIRYFTVPANREIKIDFPAVYRDNHTVIYDLKTSPKC